MKKRARGADKTHNANYAHCRGGIAPPALCMCICTSCIARAVVGESNARSHESHENWSVIFAHRRGLPGPVNF